MIRASGFALLALVLAGCSVPTAGVSPSGLAVNQCKDDSDCAGARCDGGLCLGDSGSLTALLVTVTPPSTVPDVEGVTLYKSYLAPGADGSCPDGQGCLPMGGGGLDDIELDPVDVSGYVTIDSTCIPSWSDAPDAATYIGGPMSPVIPVKVTFTPNPGVAGVPTDTYHSTLVPPHRDPATGLFIPYYTFDQTLAPGSYDVYVTPAFRLAPSMEGVADCEVPPRLFLNQTVTSGSNFAFPPNSKLTVDVTWPLVQPYTDDPNVDQSFANPLDGWTLDLVEPTTGHVLSIETQVGGTFKTAPVNGDTSVTYEVTLVYSPVYTTVKNMLEPAPIGGEILRLVPPPGVTAPTILAELDGALVDVDGKTAPARIVQSELLPASVGVEFQTALSDGTPVPARVSVRATSLDGISGLSTSFSQSVDVGADGVGEVELLPGHYHVTAAAKSGCAIGSCLGTVETDWVVAPQPTDKQAGKILEFSEATTFGGQAFVYGGGPAVGATVDLVASPLAVDTNVLNVGDNSVPPIPQSNSGLVDGSGNFALDADPGTYELRVESNPSTGFPWYVRPSLVLPDASNEGNLGVLSVDLPIVYKGLITAVTSAGVVPVPRALIRAYAYVNPDGTLATKPEGATAVQVAESYADDQSGNPGAFTLLLPPSLAAP